MKMKQVIAIPLLLISIIAGVILYKADQEQQRKDVLRLAYNLGVIQGPLTNVMSCTESASDKALQRFASIQELTKSCEQGEKYGKNSGLMDNASGEALIKEITAIKGRLNLKLGDTDEALREAIDKGNLNKQSKIDLLE